MKSAITAKNGKAAALYPSSLVDKAAAGAHSTVDRLADAVPPIIDQVASGAHSTVDRAAKRLQPAAKRIGNLVQKLDRTSDSMIAGTRQYVTDHPVITLVSAVALGMLISSLTRNRD